MTEAKAAVTVGQSEDAADVVEVYTCQSFRRKMQSKGATPIRVALSCTAAMKR